MKTFAFVLLALVLVVIANVWGPIANTRAFGILFMLVAVGFAFAKQVPFSFGDTEVARLRGRAKLLAIVPVLTIGLLLTLYAPEVTCLSYRYKHLCAGPAKP